MSYGARIWGASGGLQLDENSFTVRVVYSALIDSSVPGSGRSVYIAIPGVEPSNHTAICLPNEPWSGSTSSQNVRNSQFDAQVLSGGVRVWFSNRNMPNGRIGISTQRLLVLKYK
ncbi:hypothetical protein ATI14_1782 [Pseudomonas tolaasii NCPPB 2192]|uniref:Uncharacterized protein n=1 Tax=Pseudomonas tolaasii NCPPB 2192 TaxID=564423 RepID=A0ABX4QDS4_PSETO|nr:hypothetical protein ATI14_1782 [Pseudomonas tolaasii NCPPB 2192]